jgi:hypothetical protein
MAEKGNYSKFKQVKVLLCVLGAGLAAGIIMALLMLHYYNPEGSYLAKNVLLDPENAYSLRYVEPGKKSDNRYVSEGAYFSYFDPELKEVQSIPIDREKYAKFYNLIANERSIIEPDSRIEGLFNDPHSAALALKIRRVGEDASKGVESIFSKIDFAYEGDYYRIQLRQSAPGAGWAYFYHPHIYREAVALFKLKHD